MYQSVSCLCGRVYAELTSKADEFSASEAPFFVFPIKKIL